MIAQHTFNLIHNAPTHNTTANSSDRAPPSFSKNHRASATVYTVQTYIK